MKKKTKKNNFFKNLSKKKKIALLVISVLLVFAIGIGTYFCFFYDKDTSIKDVIKKVTKQEEVKKIKIVDPDSKTRPYAVMINNLGVARPYQSGLQDAYIMYEFIVEGGITRYLALFKDVNVDRIGTIRSSRHYYLDYVLENDAIYVHWGGSEFAYNDISKLGINNVDGMTYGGKYFWKDKSLNVSTEHTAYSKTEMIDNAVNKLGYRKETNKDLLLNYSVDPVDLASDQTSIDANSIDIVYSNVVKDHYDYDSENKVYKRSVNGKEHVDYVTKQQYTFKNIITYKVTNTTISGDYKGRQNLDNIGSGDGYYISEGKAVEITWTKNSREAQTIYKLKSTGEELKVNDGNTFIQIQPTGQTLTIS